MRDLIEDILKAPVDGDGNESEQSHPPGWKQMSLSDLLSDEQMRQLERLLKANPDPEDALKAMKQYFGTIGAELESKGVVPAYLAYVLYAKLTGAIP